MSVDMYVNMCVASRNSVQHLSGGVLMVSYAFSLWGALFMLCISGCVCARVCD